MPFITNRGQQIQYTVTGDGPTVVLQHGLFQRGDDWRRDGYVDAFSDAYRVVCVDSLGHGESDKPLGPAAYRRAARAADITGVLDELGVSRAHLIGYSMGGWISSGVAVENPDRLASLVVGGWDLVDGANKIAAEIIGFTGDSLTFDDVLAGVRTLDPNLVAWVTPEAEAGLARVLGCHSPARERRVGGRRPQLSGSPLARSKGSCARSDASLGTDPRPSIPVGAGRPSWGLRNPRQGINRGAAAVRRSSGAPRLRSP